MVAHTVQSRKGKGRKLQQLVRDKLLEKHSNSLQQGDIESRGMGQSGTDIILSPLAQTFIPFDIECKAQENLSIWKCLNQAETNTKETRIPLLVFRRARSKTYCCLEFDKLLELMR